MDRKQKSLIIRDLKKKMVFISGPRQVGKTWLAKELAKEFSSPIYLNWDELDHRQVIKNKSWPLKTNLLIFDEIHKMPQWKNYLKGLFDTKKDELSILVTGSARLEHFRKGGDSLAGRFFRHRLGPLTIAELPSPQEDDVGKLMKRGGFPEPFLATDDESANRWRLQYMDGLIRNDILDFEKLHDFRAIEQILQLLRRKVTSPVSYKSIAEDVQVSPNTVKKYIHILEELYIIFRVTPYSKNIARSLLKEPKIYFYDTGMVVGDDGQRFENFTAVSILKHLHLIEDLEGKQSSLYYLRTKEGKEVDFVLEVDNHPDMIVEAKLAEKILSPQLHYFHQKYKLKAAQVVKDLVMPLQHGQIQIMRAFDFLKDLKG